MKSSDNGTPGNSLSPREAARFLGIGQTFFYQLLKDRRLKARKLGRRTIVFREDIDAFLASLPIIGGTSPSRSTRSGSDRGPGT